MCPRITYKFFQETACVLKLSLPRAKESLLKEKWPYSYRAVLVSGKALPPLFPTFPTGKLYEDFIIEREKDPKGARY